MESGTRGARPPERNPAQAAEPGEWAHGWQYYASFTRDTYFREHQVLPAMSRSARASHPSCAGPQEAAWLSALPTSPGTTLSPTVFQIALRRRLRLPLLLGARRCEGRGCRAWIHRVACAITGRLRRRAKPMEHAWVMVCAEAGAVVADQVLLRDTNVPGIGPEDSRQLDLVAWVLRGFGRPICGDATHHYCPPVPRRHPLAGGARSGRGELRARRAGQGANVRGVCIHPNPGAAPRHHVTTRSWQARTPTAISPSWHAKR